MTALGNEEIIDTFLDYIRYLTIISHVNGRVRIKASCANAKKLILASQYKDMQESDINDIIANIRGILDWRINKLALSVTIQYDPAIIPYSLWGELDGLGDRPAKRDTVRGELLAIMEG